MHLKLKSVNYFQIASVFTFVALFLASYQVGSAQEAAATTIPQTKSMWHMIKHGGPTLVLLGGCSIFTLTLIFERFMYYRKVAGSSEELLSMIKRSGTLSEALAAIGNAPGIAARVTKIAIQAGRDGYPVDQIERLVEGEVTKELIQMEKFRPQLDSMVTLCPLLGLLGTTVGMIRSFSVVASIGMTKPEMLAGGISEALINTATGLAVAIPALFAFNYFSGKKEAILMDMEKGLSELMVILRTSMQH